MARSVFTKSLQAERDLEDLFDYIASDSGVQRAEAVLKRIERTLENLADRPLLGRIQTQLDGSPRTFSV
ncbi:MAG TPA: type II toxin-antitoxin system RelE/ParE family toxin [Rhizomicrobium sp.]|nr:type II toxin-antitoxin system RelE/ParE family toxin [Rhizomicrobium sp.]